MDDNVATLLAQVSRLMRRAFDASAREIGVTRPQWQVLGVLSLNGGIKQGMLAEILEVEPITAGRMIDRLQDADLVERRADPSDRRAWRLHLTSRGTQLLDQLRPFAQDTLEMALEGIDGAERAALVAQLVRIRGNLARRTIVPAMTTRAADKPASEVGEIAANG
jgi:DNA-binding MarR family transcriptional regulator